MAHAVLGAVVAELNNQSAAAGGLGAGGGELSAKVVMDTLFPGKKVSDLTESEKQQVSALSQLASGLAGGLTTGDVAGAITGSQAAKNAVENNSLSQAGKVAWWLVRPSTIGAPVTTTAPEVLMSQLGLTQAQAEDFLSGLSPFGEGNAIRLALADPAGNEEFTKVVLATYEQYGSLANSSKNEGTDSDNKPTSEQNSTVGVSTGSPNGVEPPNDDKKKNESKNKETTVDDLIETSQEGRKTTGRAKQYERSGGMESANRDFDALSPTNVREIPSGRVGKLPDGSTVIVRTKSSDGRPTLEIQHVKNKQTKFRYGE